MAYPFFKKLAGILGLGSFVRDWDTVKASMDSEADALALVSGDSAPVYINAAGKKFFNPHNKRRIQIRKSRKHNNTY